ncbi:TPA: fimbrillin family protein [Elizabethkingia anophelis]
MKKDSYIITGIAILSVLLFNACRSSDTDNNITNGIASVNINLLGTEFSNSSPALNASLDKNKNYISEIQTYSILVNPSTIITTELAPSSDPVNTLAKISDKKLIAAIPGNNLGTGIKFRVIAYRQSNGNYHTHQDYTVGQPATPMMLDNGGTYNIVVYSYGTASLPAISSGEQNNISSASVNYDDTNRDFMYQKINYTPVNDNNTLNITLRHMVAQITTIIKNSTTQWTGNNIISVTNAIISPHYNNGIFSLNTGSMSGRTTSTNAVITFPTPSGGSIIATPVFINNDTNGNLAGTFSAKVSLSSGSVENILAKEAFKIVPETKSNLTINLRTCGAFLGPGNTQWKDFMCHNLGADQSADPFTPSAAIHGAKYQWGRSTAAVTQAQDQNNNGVITGWDMLPAPDDAWSDTSKTINDPCPTGYRVPTQAQWQAIFDNNPVSYIGNWSNSTDNYSSGVKIGNNLFLPASGIRPNNTNISVVRGSDGYYWSTGIFNNMSISTRFNNGKMIAPANIRTDGEAIRCIAE